MKQPKSKLPFERWGRLSINIDDAKGDNIATGLYSEDADYMIEACNNYPKAVELLEDIQRRIANMVEPNMNPRVNECWTLIQNFLHEIESNK